jgi:cyclopropane-fatty-acyl-phospholipid synthase
MQLAERFERLVHTVRSPQILENRLEKLVERVRATQPVPMRLRLWSGRSYELGPDPGITLTVPKPAALRYLLSPDLMKLGEAYVEGHIDLDGPIHEVFRVGEHFVSAAGGGSALGPLLRLRRHSKSRDRAAIQYHYDVSNEFYSLFLDRKLDHILTKLRLRPGERLLDIGCGWGALVFRAVEKFGARAVGITLSEKQHEYAREQIRARGLADRCEVRLQDYRDVPEAGGFDKISSVGMFEHVGLKNLGLYFGRIRALLKDGGLVLNHGITSVDPDSRSVGRGAGDFIDKYVFPDGELPHIGLVLREMSAGGLESVDVESLRRHYAKTTSLWADRLEANRERAVSIAGEKRYRIWAIYLAGCAFGFAHNWINIYQVLACKQGGPGMNTLPLTRDYMYR